MQLSAAQLIVYRPVLTDQPEMRGNVLVHSVSRALVFKIACRSRDWLSEIPLLYKSTSKTSR